MLIVSSSSHCQYLCPKLALEWRSSVSLRFSAYGWNSKVRSLVGAVSFCLASIYFPQNFYHAPYSGSTANFVLPPNSVQPSASQLEFQDLCRLSAWKELLPLILPMWHVKWCCSHCVLCCEVPRPLFPPRLLARSNDPTYVQVDSR